MLKDNSGHHCNYNKFVTNNFVTHNTLSILILANNYLRFSAFCPQIRHFINVGGGFLENSFTHSSKQTHKIVQIAVSFSVCCRKSSKVNRSIPIQSKERTHTWKLKTNISKTFR